MCHSCANDLSEADYNALEQEDRAVISNTSRGRALQVEGWVVIIGCIVGNGILQVMLPCGNQTWLPTIIYAAWVLGFLLVAKGGQIRSPTRWRVFLASVVLAQHNKWKTEFEKQKFIH
jgi:hypothetical protein